jgi:NADPH2:quinone reductase
VLVTGCDLGVASDGGYPSRVRVPSARVVPVPEGLTEFEAMAPGTAGFTAGLAILRLEQNGPAPGKGPVVVTGATGGVGSVGVASLSTRGYQVVAVTGKAAEEGYLRGLGAREGVGRTTIEMGTRPLEKARWAGAVDAVGGDLLAWLTRTDGPLGGHRERRLTGGVDVHQTVMPFILRGRQPDRIDSVLCPIDHQNRRCS